MSRAVLIGDEVRALEARGIAGPSDFRPAEGDLPTDMPVCELDDYGYSKYGQQIDIIIPG